MRILSYSPSVEAYIAASGKGGAVEYYDVSRDIIDCSVTRSQDASSTFTLKLQNKNGKYNNKFAPMDRITIYATKKKQRNQLLTGYITSVPRFTLYPEDMSISGHCSLYRLEQLYWDSKLPASQEALGIGQEGCTHDDVIRNLLINVAGMNEKQVAIGTIPQEVRDWAMKLYQAHKLDISGLNDAVTGFSDMLSGIGVLSQFNYGTTIGLAPAADEVKKVAVPDSVQQTGIIADYTGYNKFYGRWSNGTNQKTVSELWASNGKTYNRNIAVIGQRFLVAVRPQFGKTGDYLRIYLEDGTKIDAIMADEKGSDAAEWGHVYGGGKISVVEFEVNQGVFSKSDLGDWYGKRVVAIGNLGSCLS